MLTSTIQKRWRPAIKRPAGLLLLVALAALSIGCVEVEAGDGGFVMGGTIHVAEGEVAREELVAVGGSITIDGEARRDVVVVGGRLTINGEAHRNVSCIGGTLVLGPGARVGGDAVVVGGELRRDPTARVDGELVRVGFGRGFGNIFGGGLSPIWWGGWWGFSPGAWMWTIIRMLTWLVLALLTAALVGDRISSASHAIARDPIRLWLIGIVGIFAFWVVVCLSILFWVVLIGIPITFGLLAAGVAAYVFGLVAIFQLMGARLMKAFGRPEASQVAMVLAGGLVLYIVCSFLPILGEAAWWLILGPLGFGAVFATRFGTNRPWIRRFAAPSPPPAAGSPASAAPSDAGSEPPAEPGAMEFDEPADEGYSTSSYAEPEEPDEGASSEEDSEPREE